MNTRAPRFMGTLKRVEKGWIDYNGHFNMAYYAVPFDRTVAEIFDEIGVGETYRKRTNHSFFTLAAQLNYLQELHQGDPLGMTFRMIDMDEKRVHFIMEMYHAEKMFRAATMESLVIHIDMRIRKSAPMLPEAYEAFRVLMEQQKGLPVPPEAGGCIGIRRKGRESTTGHSPS